MIKHIAILAILAVGFGCNKKNVGGALPPLPACPNSPPVFVPEPTPQPACGDVGQPCCQPVEGDPSCKDGLVCDSTNTCVTTTPPDMGTTTTTTTDTPDMAQQSSAPDMAQAPDMTPPDPCAGVVCPAAGQVCTNGTCDCATSGQTVCGNSCTDTTTDNNNCGQCGTACTNGATCAAGVCVPPVVDPCANVTCANQYVCVDGTCQPPPPPYCDYNQNCTYSYGYWKQHWVCSVSDLRLGTVFYTNTQLLSILNQAVNGNNLVELAHQLIGAKMNIIKGANATGIQSTVDAADLLIGGLVVPPIGTGAFTTTSDNASAVSLAGTLANFNLGNSSSPHCQ